MQSVYIFEMLTRFFPSSFGVVTKKQIKTRNSTLNQIDLSNARFTVALAEDHRLIRWRINNFFYNVNESSGKINFPVLCIEFWRVNLIHSPPLHCACQFEISRREKSSRVSHSILGFPSISSEYFRAGEFAENSIALKVKSSFALSKPLKWNKFLIKFSI